ncbi:MAG: hypothetical protein D6E12_08345 [Desulfovibrio sp.]|nr:MAG: hypothetical protein D6E12_08345 [Desulfovibrio sp.]
MRFGVVFGLCCLVLLTATSSFAAQENMCRRVVIEGEVSVRPDPEAHAQEEGRGLLVCTAEGDLRMEMIFPMEGGNPIKQQNSVTMTNFRCFPFGTAQPCEATPYPDPDQIIEFTLLAELEPESVTVLDENDRVVHTMDGLYFRIDPMPEVDVLTVYMVCGGVPDDVDHPGSVFQLLLPFIENYWNHSITLNAFVDKTYTDYPIGMERFLADMNWTQFETIVPCANYP